MALQPAPSARRAAEIVNLLAAEPSEVVAVAEIARRVGQSRATCHAVLLALEPFDWVRRDESGGYSLGSGLIAVGAAAQRSTALVQRLRATVDGLLAETGHEATACVTAGAQMVIVARAVVHDPLLANTGTIGQVYPFEPPNGLAFVAFDEARLEQWLQRSSGLTEHARGSLRTAAGLVRQSGYGVMLDRRTREAMADPGAGMDADARSEAERILAQDELLYGAFDTQRSGQVSYVTAPVFTADEVIALVGLLVRSNHPIDIPRFAHAVTAAAARLTDELALPGPGAAGASLA